MLYPKEAKKMSQPVIDVSMLTSLVEDTDAEFVNELIDTYLEDSPHQIADMQRALSQKNNENFRRAAHTLKSNSANFGATALAEMAQELEYIGKENNLEGATDKLTAFESAYAQVVIELKAWQDGNQ
jgi:HPt (histidine-containing phosphotransfer) domain-containing protein